MFPLIIAATVVIGLAVALVVIPLFRKPESVSEHVVSASLAEIHELEVQRDNLYQALRDLEFDHQVGKITDDDYDGLSMRYKMQAADVLRRLTALTNGAGSRHASLGDASLDDALEAEIRARRQAVGPAPAATAQAAATEPAAPPADPAATAPRFCTSCGHRVGPNDRFCANCGAPVQR